MIPGFILNPNALQTTLTNKRVATRTAAVLDKHYPRHIWTIEVDAEGGVINVRNKNLPGRWGFTDRLAQWTEQRMVRFAGELFERYRIRRGRADVEQMKLMGRQRFYRPEL